MTSMHVSQQRPVLVKGHVTAKVSQSQLQSFPAKACSCHRACPAKLRPQNIFLRPELVVPFSENFFFSLLLLFPRRLLGSV